MLMIPFTASTEPATNQPEPETQGQAGCPSAAFPSRPRRWPAASDILRNIGAEGFPLESSALEESLGIFVNDVGLRNNFRRFFFLFLCV